MLTALPGSKRLLRSACVVAFDSCNSRGRPFPRHFLQAGMEDGAASAGGAEEAGEDGAAGTSAGGDDEAEGDAAAGEEDHDEL